jgi:hypothetical protein
MTDLDRLESAAIELLAAYNACGFGGEEDKRKVEKLCRRLVVKCREHRHLEEIERGDRWGADNLNYDVDLPGTVWEAILGSDGSLIHFEARIEIEDDRAGMGGQLADPKR